MCPTHPHFNGGAKMAGTRPATTFQEAVSPNWSFAGLALQSREDRLGFADLEPAGSLDP